MKLWKKLILWGLIWFPVSHVFQQNPHVPMALFAPLVGFFSFPDLEGWQGNELWELTLPWFTFWSVFVAIIDVHLANKNSIRRVLKLKPRQAFWLVVVLFFGGVGLYIRHEKQKWPEEDCERLGGDFDESNGTCKFPK